MGASQVASACTFPGFISIIYQMIVYVKSNEPALSLHVVGSHDGHEVHLLIASRYTSGSRGSTGNYVAEGFFFGKGEQGGDQV